MITACKANGDRRRWLARSKKRVSSQKGLGLVETLVALAILGTSVVAFAAALSAGSIAAGAQQEEVVAQCLARTQLEYTKSYPYNAKAVTYPAVDAPEGYTVAVGVASIPGADADIQKVMVSVYHNGASIMTVNNYKVNR